jgi:hypothetical protein
MMHGLNNTGINRGKEQAESGECTQKSTTSALKYMAFRTASLFQNELNLS